MYTVYICCLYTLFIYAVYVLNLDLHNVWIPFIYSVYVYCLRCCLYILFTCDIFIFLLLHTQVFLRVQFMSLCFSRCILGLCMPLSTHTIIQHSFSDDLLLQISAPLIKYLSYFTLCSHVLVMPKLGQLQTCLNLMTTRHSSCLSPLTELCISIAYLFQSLWAMLRFPQTVCEEFGFYIRLSSYYECTRLQYCSDMLL